MLPQDIANKVSLLLQNDNDTVITSEDEEVVEVAEVAEVVVI